MKEQDAKKVSIVFTGDIGFDAYMDGRWNDPELVSGEIMDFLRAADHVAADVEGALIRADEAEDIYDKGVLFHVMDPASSVFLERIGADIWDFANNHTMDAGPGGLESAAKVAAQRGARFFGAGKDIESASAPLIVEGAGGIGIIGVGYMPTCVRAGEGTAGVFGWDEDEVLRRRIREVKEHCRWCVIEVHGGEEFTALPSPYVRERYLGYLEMGADIVVGHHPHVPLNYELTGGKAVFYSLGNFIFDTNYQRTQLDTDKGALLRIDFSEDGFSFEALGTRLDREAERVCAGPLPDIFTEVPAEEYALLIDTAAAAFLQNEKKRARFMMKGEGDGYTEEQWENYFRNEPLVPYVQPGIHNDFGLLYDMALSADPSKFEKSRLEKVKANILRQIEG